MGMQKFQQQNELKKTLNRFNKIRLFHNYGYMNILPVKYLKKNANKYKQVQLNTDTHFNAIIMDIDDEDLLTEWNAIGLPTPSIQTLNKDNDKAHLVWLLNVPVSKRNRKAVKYYKTIVESIKVLIGADKAYQNHQTKNFLNSELYRITYNDLAYDLEDFKDFIIREEKYKIPHHPELADYESTGSRHIDLFNQLRLYGYKVAKHSNLLEKLQKRAEIINEQFDEPIKPKAIIKSVLAFCEENKNNFKAARKYRAGAMKFKKIANLSQAKYIKEVSRRQSKSATRTKDIKRIRTAAKIKIAIEVLLRHKTKLTYSNIAKQAKVSPRTVKRYSKIVKILVQKVDGVISSIRVIVLEAEERSTLPLKYWKGTQVRYYELPI
jgi:hypothetical protein